MYYMSPMRHHLLNVVIFTVDHYVSLKVQCTSQQHNESGTQFQCVMTHKNSTRILGHL